MELIKNFLDFALIAFGGEGRAALVQSIVAIEAEWSFLALAHPESRAKSLTFVDQVCVGIFHGEVNHTLQHYQEDLLFAGS